MPRVDNDEDWSFCVGNGWGRTGLTKINARIMLELPLPLVASSTCERRLKSTGLGRYFKLDKSFICAGSESGEEYCRGDGPLTCKSKQDGQLYQLGITTWGFNCTEPVPSLYASVKYAACWIDQQVSCNSDQRDQLSELNSRTGYFGFDWCPEQDFSSCWRVQRIQMSQY